MFVKYRGAFMLVAAVALTVAAAQAQGLKIAIINAQKSVAGTQELKKAQADLSTKYLPRQQQIEKLQNDLQQIETQLHAGNLTPEKEQQLNLDGQDKQKQLKRLSDDLQSDFNDDRADILSRASTRMQGIIKTLAEQKGFDMVVDVNNTLYYRPAMDITADATAAYDKAYPVTASSK